MKLAFRDEVPPVPVNNKPGLKLSPKMLLIGGGGLAVIIIAIVLIGMSSSGGISPQLQRLSARLTTLEAMIDESTGSISDPDLNKLNSDLSILTKGSSTQLAAPMKAAGMDKVGDDVKKAEADTATISTLTEAKLTGNFDRIYARIIKLKIDTILALMNEIYAKTKSPSLKQALLASYNDLSSIRKQLDTINV